MVSNLFDQALLKLVSFYWSTKFTIDKTIYWLAFNSLTLTQIYPSFSNLLPSNFCFNVRLYFFFCSSLSVIFQNSTTFFRVRIVILWHVFLCEDLDLNSQSSTLDTKGSTESTLFNPMWFDIYFAFLFSFKSIECFYFQLSAQKTSWGPTNDPIQISENFCAPFAERRSRTKNISQSKFQILLLCFPSIRFLLLSFVLLQFRWVASNVKKQLTKAQDNLKGQNAERPSGLGIREKAPLG